VNGDSYTDGIVSIRMRVRALRASAGPAGLTRSVHWAGRAEERHISNSALHNTGINEVRSSLIIRPIAIA